MRTDAHSSISPISDISPKPESLCSLRDLAFPSFLDTSSNNLIDEFFTPALAHSNRYDRGVGFFSSGWLRIAAQGMVAFAANGGRSRWVTSPILNEHDWEAMQVGDSARSDAALRAVLDRNIGSLATALEKDTLSALAWMVAEQILDFKLALPHSKLDKGDFQNKVGIFSDVEWSLSCFDNPLAGETDAN